MKTRTSFNGGKPVGFVDKIPNAQNDGFGRSLTDEMDIDKPARFDIIGLVWNGRGFDLEHIDDAFLPFL